MKSILELISMIGEDGSSVITPVKARVNQLMELTESGFSVGDSTSRSGEDGALTDLRTSLPLLTSDPRTTEIRRRLTLLQNKYDFIKFEEKINQDTNQSTFIITEIAYPEFLNETKLDFQFPTEDMHFPEVNSVIIRHGLHDFNCNYVGVKVGTQIVCRVDGLHGSEEPSPREHDAIINYRKSDTNNFSIMELIASPDQNAFHEIKKLLNQFCDLPANNEFALYFQSSNPDFPIDLRVFLDKDDEKGKLAQLKLSGLAIANNNIEGNLVYEIKSFENSNQIAIIIKAIDKDCLERHFNRKTSMQHLEGEQLEKALSLIKEYFPNDKHIKDLVIVSGKGSYTRPFPHIRTKNFWSDSEIDPDTNRVLLDLSNNLDCIDYIKRPENKFKVEKRNNDIYWKPSSVNVSESSFFNSKNDNCQLIIVPKDIDSLQKGLDSLTRDKSHHFN